MNNTYKGNFWEFTTGFHGIRLGYTPCSYYDKKQFVISLGRGILFIDIGESKYSNDVNDETNYGFYYYGSYMWFQFGKKTKSIKMPWCYEWVRTSYLNNDGSWETENKYTKKNKGAFSLFKDSCNNLFEQEYPYTYKLKNGTVQERIATVTVEEREWRPLWFMWTKLFRRVNKTISVEFDDEVGERTGSWKGGAIGCSYTMKGNETPLETLMRMEKERKL